MNQELMNFEYAGKAIRVLGTNAEPVFVAKDIVEAVGAEWKGVSGSIPHVPEDFRGVLSVQTPSGTQNMTVLNEAGLNMYLFRSDKPAALPFQRKLASEVLPTIRKHGIYATEMTVESMLNDPDVMITALRALKEERIAKVNAQLAAKEAEQKALVAQEAEQKALEARDLARAKEERAAGFVRAISDAPSTENLLLREMSKKFQSNGWNCTEKPLQKALLAAGVLMKGSRGITATSKAVTSGWCVVGNSLGEKIASNNMTGWSGEVTTARFTAKGVAVVGKNMEKLGFEKEPSITILDLELNEEN